METTRFLFKYKKSGVEMASYLAVLLTICIFFYVALFLYITLDKSIKNIKLGHMASHKFDPRQLQRP